MTNALDFIRWALTHVNPNTVPSGAVLANGTATVPVHNHSTVTGS